MTRASEISSQSVPQPGTDSRRRLRARRARRRIVTLACQLLVAVVLIGGWQVLTELRVLDPFFFSEPSGIARRIGGWVSSQYIWRQLGVTLLESAVSLLIGGAAGIAAGFLLGRFALLADVSSPFIATFNALPRIVFAPMFIIWFGLGIWSKVALGVSLVFFIVFYSTFSGVKNVDKTLLNNTRMLGANGIQQFRHVILPYAASWILASLHTSVGFAISGAVVAEYLGSSEGMGYVIANAEGVFDITTVMAGVTVLSVFVVAIIIFIKKLEKYLLRWQGPGLEQ
jgi:NitT/TauT family transport system permease protein